MEAYKSKVPAGRDGFDRLLRAEWAKLWSVPRWVLSLGLAIVLTVMIALLAAAGSGNESDAGGGGDGGGGGKGGKSRMNDYRDEGFFLHQPLPGDGSIVARVTSQHNSHKSAKAGVMIRKSTESGSPYAAMMVTPQQGVRLQANFKTDIKAGNAGGVPRWLKLTRSGGSVTGYESADGVTWRKVGTVTLGELAPTAEAGMFVASPNGMRIKRQFGGESIDEYGTTGRATFDNVRVEAAGASRQGPWRQENNSLHEEDGRATESGGTFALQGSGDLAHFEMSDDLTQMSLTGVVIGLMAIVALAVLFMTSEYKRGMIRTTFTVSPRRGRVLAAKSIVIGVAAFGAGLIAALTAFLVAQPILRANGLEPPLFSQPSLSDGPVLRALLGTAALLAIIAVFSTAMGAILRHSALAITTVILLLVVPQIVATGLPLSAAKWLERLTPTAGFAIQQTKERYDTAIGPWAGLGVLSAYTAIALLLALWLLRRRDA